MSNSIIIGLLQNTAILLAFAMLYESIWVKSEESKSVFLKILMGLSLSAIGVVLMFTPWTLMPGIVFDTRSIMISVSGLFFGPIPTIITMAITGAVRLLIGGNGQYMGLAVIILSGTIGLLWRKFRFDWKNKNYYLELLAMGLIVHLVMSACTLLLPKESIWPTFKTIIGPIIFIYSPATMLLGVVMLKQYKNWQNRNAQIKLLETERRLSQVLESGNIVSLLLNKEMSILFCNNYFLEITGYTKVEIFGKNWVDVFIPQNSKNEFEQLFFQGIKTKNIVRNYENKILTKSGQEIYILWHNILTLSENHDATGIASIGVDITNSKIYELKLEEKNKEIEAQNEEYKLLNFELQTAKEKAEESNRLKTAFLLNMSHEIKTPMNAINGFAGLLNRDDISEEKRRTYASIIVNSSNQLQSIVENILTISALETKIEKANISPVCINDILKDLFFIFNKQASERKISLNCKPGLPDNESEILSDKTKITQILSNLISNALKFTNAGFIEFGYNLKQDEQAAELEFYVKDTGIGISPDMQSKIFERFIQIETGFTRRYGGNGLGLSISKGFVELLEGNIWVESEPENLSADKQGGSVFYFTIPYRIASKKEVKLNFFNDKLSPSANILIAEDEEFNFLYIKELLANFNVSYLRACNGSKAVEICKSNPKIDLILMDIKMPEMDGLNAAKIIKEFMPEVPVIAHSAYTYEQYLEIYNENPFNEYVSKPLKIDEFKRIMQKYLK